ncbi:MAG: hypothetical protein IKA10_08015 [Oscillospiraceae bacterium]|nr:hypothetical protein [Oscillospiraceae bacterium]
MEIFKIALLIITVLVISGGIPALSKEITVIMTFSCCIVVLLYILEQIIPAVNYIKSIASNISFSGMDIILKSVGVGFVTQLVSDIALDSNNRTLADQMVFAGRVCILMLAMPVFMDVFKIIEKLTNGL